MSVCPSDFVAGQTGDHGMPFQQCEPGKVATRPVRLIARREQLTWLFA